MKEKPDPDALLTAPEAARVLGLGASTIRTLIARHRLPATRKITERGPVYLIRRGDLDRYAASRAYNDAFLPTGYVSSLPDPN